MPIDKLFIDSGAFSLGPLVKNGKLNGTEVHSKWKNEKWSWYDTKEYKQYIDRYARFVQEHKECIDVFVNVDVLDDPDRTYRNQKYIEDKHGISPVPVIHSFTEQKYIDRYLEDGHDYIALGGMGGKQMHKRMGYRKWIDTVFTRLCPKSNGYKPIIKMHGFAVTSWHSMTRYPWYSVDSTTYVKMAGYGWLLVPLIKQNRSGFRFDKEYTNIGVCSEPTDNVKKKSATKHKIPGFKHEFISPAAAKSLSMRSIKHIGSPSHPNIRIRERVELWLDHIDIPFGTEDGKVLGVVNDSTYRIKANLHYFDQLGKHLPEWPWAFRNGGGLLV